MARWFEMRFTFVLYRCVFSLDALLCQIGFQSVSCVTSWILGTLMAVSWRTRWGAWQPQSLKNVLWGIWKVARHGHHQMSQERHAPSSHCFVYGANLSLHSEARHDCSTEHRNVHRSVPLSLSSVAEFSIATWQRIWIARWCIYIFPVVVLQRCKAGHHHTYWRWRRYHSNPCREVGTEWLCLDTTNPIWSLAVTVRTVCVKNQIWETKWICLQSEQGLRYCVCLHFVHFP